MWLVRFGLIGCLVLLLLAPAAWADTDVRTVTGYRKGRPLELKLVTIDWIEVEVTTARAFEAMRRAAAVDGIELVIRSGFRDHEKQAWLYRAWKGGWGNPAARPGHSNHQSGRALDLVVRDRRVRSWLATNARTFGFRRTVRREPWHWELFPTRAARRR
ncbi:MAG: peptidase [Myxococcales bacterium]|nr:peptidase [Myxococcales bacterium]